MSDKSINYFLIETNRIKVGGYVSVRYQLLLDLVDLIYSDNKVALTSLQSKFNKYNSTYSDNKGGILIGAFVENISHTERYLATSENCSFVKNLYVKAQLVDSYKEFAFILFLLGLVNSQDYLKHNKSIDYVVSKMDVKRRRTRKETTELIQPIIITYTNYARLMGLYLKNTTEGVDYGFTAYDFIYHMLNATGSSRANYTMFNKYEVVISRLKELKISNFKPFQINSAVLNKYTEEVGVMLPLLVKYLTPKNLEKILFKISDTCDFALLEALLKDESIVTAAEKGCVQSTICYN